eukprot:95311_1
MNQLTHMRDTTRMLLNSTLQWRQEGLILNLLQKNDRNIAVQLMLSNLITDNAEFEIYSDAKFCEAEISNVATYVAVSVMLFDFIDKRNMKKLSFAIGSIMDTIFIKVIDIKSYDNILCRLWLIFSTFGINILILKHLFRCDDEVKLWINLVSSAIKSLSIAQYINHKSQHGIYLFLLKMMKYWRYKHCKLAYDCKFFELVGNMHCDSLQMNSLICIERSGRSIVLYSKFISCLSCSNRARKLNTYFTQSLKDRFKKSGVEYDDFIKYVKKWQTQNYVHKNFRICGWPLCTKQLHEFESKNICKGCHLIRYCGKNHQKKHWKYIHSQQCLNLSKEENC